MKYKKIFVSLVFVLLLVTLAGCFKSQNTPNSNQKVLRNGFYLQFGSYKNEPILWKILDDKPDGLILASNNILCVKAFDAAESGIMDKAGGKITNNVNSQKFGSNDWKTSNIREWLNSEEATVSYSTQAPNKQSAYSEVKPFEVDFNEKGFLDNFSQKEKDILLKVTHEGVDDRVYLLSEPETTLLGNTKRNYKGGYFPYWTRTQFGSFEKYINIDGSSAANNPYMASGILPSIKINSDVALEGSGTEKDPYKIAN